VLRAGRNLLTLVVEWPFAPRQAQPAAIFSLSSHTRAHYQDKIPGLCGAVQMLIQEFSATCSTQAAIYEQ
jgi:hypothetical protein